MDTMRFHDFSEIGERMKMPIKNATAAEIAALKEKLQRRQSDRKYEMQMDEAVAMAGKKRKPKNPRSGKEAENPAAGDAAILAAIGFLGALSWNVFQTGYGLAVFAICAAGFYAAAVKGVKNYA